MASQKVFVVVMFHMLLVPLLFDLAYAQLKFGYYAKTCLSLESIVKETTANYINRAPTLAAPILRMSFHDCFVNVFHLHHEIADGSSFFRDFNRGIVQNEGCDASILLNSTKNIATEKDSPPNAFLRGYHVIDAVKAAIEKACPGVVSCADILSLVVRDAVSLINGPYWKVELGRKDGKVSSSAQALATLPGANFNISTLKSIFKSNGLNSKDLAVLSGAHTIGIGHCFLLTNRLYNFTGKGDTDPSLDSNYLSELKKKCKPTITLDTTTFVEMDPGSFKRFDTSYYSLVAKRRGLFQSDSALMDDTETSSYVKLQTSSESTFYKDFGESMIRMSRINVLTGNAGEIRKHCAFVN